MHLDLEHDCGTDECLFPFLQGHAHWRLLPSADTCTACAVFVPVTAGVVVIHGEHSGK